MSPVINVKRDNQIIRYTYWDRELLSCRVSATPSPSAFFSFGQRWSRRPAVWPSSGSSISALQYVYMYTFMMITVFGSLSCTWAARIIRCTWPVLYARVYPLVCNSISGNRWSRKARHRRYAASHCSWNDLAEAYNITHKYYYNILL